MSIISFSFSDIFFDFHFMRAVLENIVKPAVDLYGHIVRVWVLIFPFFAIMDPEDLQIVLSSGKHTEKIFFYKLLHNFLGNGLITSSGNRTWIEKSWCELTFLKFSLCYSKVEKWSLHRRLIQPTFHVSTLETFLGTFIDAANVLVQRIKDGPSQMNITHLVNECVMDILNGKLWTR